MTGGCVKRNLQLAFKLITFIETTQSQLYRLIFASNISKQEEQDFSQFVNTESCCWKNKGRKKKEGNKKEKKKQKTKTGATEFFFLTSQIIHNSWRYSKQKFTKFYYS